MKLKAKFLYADTGMVASNELWWLQTSFDALTGLFDRVWLKTNVRKTLGIVCHPCRAAGVQAEKTYTRRMTGTGRIYMERQQ